jgi:hypothetical protein
MDEVIVRAVEEKDLPRIADLTESVFGVRRDVGLLRWLLGDPRTRERIDSWVAERAGEVVGHTAVLKCAYLVAERRLTGAHAFLWMVDPRYRGETGMALGRTIVGYGDFLIVLGGTPTTQAILAGRRFTSVAEGREFRVREWPPGSADGFDLVRRTPADAPCRVPAGVAANEAAADHLEWLARCPELEAHRLALVKSGVELGTVLLFVNRRVAPVAGRLVHLPYLGEETEPWSWALARVGREMARLGCSSWTLLATHPALVRACEAAGAAVAGSRPVWIRERLPDGLGYRRVEPA